MANVHSNPATAFIAMVIFAVVIGLTITHVFLEDPALSKPTVIGEAMRALVLAQTSTTANCTNKHNSKSCAPFYYVQKKHSSIISLPRHI